MNALRFRLLLLGACVAPLLFASVHHAQEKARMVIEKSSFGETADGHNVELYTCTNRNGLVLKMTNYGAIVVSLETPDANGKLANINLGFPNLEGYLGRHPYFGATVGRFCNRIAKASFKLGGESYQLAANNPPNHLHGGEVGFDKRVWSAEAVEDVGDAIGVRFQYRSPDGEEGYPGTLEVTATYLLTNNDELKILLEAESSEDTPVNLTNHCYWNLAGDKAGNIHDHRLTLSCDQYLPVDDNLIPTGKFADVAGTPMDFRQAKPIGSDLQKAGGDPVGFDHCFVVQGPAGQLRMAARVEDPASGRVMEIFTTQPGIQFYTGNFLDGTAANGGYQQYGGFCLETQHFPDSPNQPEFPTTILSPGETFSQLTVHKFSVAKP